MPAPLRIGGARRWSVKYAPFALTSNTSSKACSVASFTDPAWLIPALMNRASMPPNVSRIVVASSSISAIRDASLCTAITSSPSSRRASATCAAARPVTRTRAPSSLRNPAVARPIPLVPPMTASCLCSYRCIELAPFSALRRRSQWPAATGPAASPRSSRPRRGPRAARGARGASRSAPGSARLTLGRRARRTRR